VYQAFLDDLALEGAKASTFKRSPELGNVPEACSAKTWRQRSEPTTTRFVGTTRRDDMSGEESVAP